MSTTPPRTKGPAAKDSDELMRERPHLLNLAYRLLGTATDAEDAVQAAFGRWYALSEQERGQIESPGAWLSRVTSRICLDVLRSARVRRERYVGEWVPEPLPAGVEWLDRQPPDAADPADRVTLDESISMAFLVVLESMTPAERVAFILHDVFRFSFAEVGEVLGRSPAACRQLASSARRRLERPAEVAVPESRRADAVRSFKQAWESRDLQALVKVLDPEATVVADGGGLVPATLEPVEGRDEVIRRLLDIAERAPWAMLHERVVNGQPGLIATEHDVITTVFAFDLSPEGCITHIWAVRNPEKLRQWRLV